MHLSRFRLLGLAGFAMLLAGPAADETRPPVRSQADSRSAIHALGELPLRFEENRGQVEAHARFVARRGQRELVLADEGATLRVQDTTLTLTVDGGRTVTPVGGDLMEAKTNYLRGRDPKSWLTDVPSFAKVTYPAVKDGVDVVYHGEHGQMEYDFVVAPGTDVDGLAMNIGGGDSLSLDDDGSLAIKTARGTLRQPKPRVYQRDGAGHERAVDARYHFTKTGSVGFEVASYDRARPLVIDPEIGFATYLGGNSDDSVNGIAIDADGSVTAVGATFGGTGLAATNILPRAGVVNLMDQDDTQDVFVVKLSAKGTLEYFTTISGSSSEYAQAVTLVNGQPYVSGVTQSDDFPITQGDLTHTVNCNADGFALALNTAGNALSFSTYVTSQSCADDTAPGIAVANNVVYVGGALGDESGYVSSFPVPTSTAAITFTTKSFEGASVSGLAIDSAGLYVVGSVYGSFAGVEDVTTPSYQTNPQGGRDGFLLLLDATQVDAPEALYGTFLGGSSDDAATSVALGAKGHAYVTGTTMPSQTSGNTGVPYPTKTPYQAANAGGEDVFVTQIDTTATGAAGLVWSTFLGGTGDESTPAIGLDAAQHVFVTGTTVSNDFPTAPRTDATRTDSDAFVAELSADGTSLVYAQLLGGASTLDANGNGSAGIDYGQAIAVNATGIAFGGQTEGSFPVKSALQATYGGGNADGWIARIDTTTALALSPATVTLAAGATQTFTATGGVGAYTFSLPTSTTGGNVVAGTGVYTAGQTAGTDTVRVTDLIGNVASSTVVVTVTPLPSDTSTAAPPTVIVPTVDAGGGSNLNIGVGNAQSDDSSCSVGRVGSTSSTGALALVGLALALLAGRRRRL